MEQQQQPSPLNRSSHNGGIQGGTFGSEGNSNNNNNNNSIPSNVQVPVLNNNNNRNNDTNHYRVYSGDSFMTTPSAAGIIPHHPSNLSTQQSLSPNRLNRTTNDSASNAGGGGGTILRVNDIIKANPLESEAETLIMKAIERQQAQAQQQQKQRSRTNTMESGSLLGNAIPDDSIGIFTEEKKHTTFAESNMTSSPTVTSVERQQRPPRPPLQSQPAVMKPLIISRNQTTQETLAALTQAMEEYQDHNHNAINSAANDPEYDYDAWLLQNNEKAQSAAVFFAQNANIVFGNHHHQKHPPHTAATTTKKPTTTNMAQQLPSSSINTTSSTSLPPNPEQQSPLLNSAGTNSIGTHWNKLRDAVKTATVAEMNGIDTSMQMSEDPNKSSLYNKDDDDDKNGGETLSPDIEVGHDIPFDESNNNNRNSMNSVPPPPPPPPSLPPNSSDPMENNSTRLNNNSSRHHPTKSMNMYQAISKGGPLQDLQLFIKVRRQIIVWYTRVLVLLIIPAITAACFLFYFFGNPSVGVVDIEILRYNNTLINTKNVKMDPNKASISWWILFICVRQALTFSIAQFLQVLIIDFLCLNTRIFKTLFGNLITLLIAQSKGWPFILFTWGLIDFALLQGPSKFVSSWLYWQDIFDVFNEANYGGAITSSYWNKTILLIAIWVGITVSVKRLWLGLFLGKKTYINYAEELTNVVKKALLLCEVATLARLFYYDLGVSMKAVGINKEALSMFVQKSLNVQDQNDDNATAERQALISSDDDIYNGGLIVNSRSDDLLRGHLDQSQRTRIVELLGAWEEPEAEGDTQESVTISSILQFRNSLTLLDSSFMFGIAWGDVSTRAKMVVSSQDVYQRLLLPTPDSNVLKFETLARIAMEADGMTLNEEKLEALVRLLRPDRDGNLSLLDFVKSTDTVYKEAKLLRASIKNSEHIDRAFEKALNVVFYVVMACIILSRIGIDPMALFLSLSGLILAFAFMIGSAASKMFDGFLFILVRRPYNIGDRIHISGVETDTNPTGSAGWIVKDVTLFNTTLVYGATGERATVANGSLSQSRVINMARSPKATISINLKFATDSPYERIKVYEQSLRDFVKARPREWANFNGFRAGTIYPDLGYIEYSVSLTHREAWQNVIAIINSKAEVAAFCLELSKQLDLPVSTPTLPVTLSFAQGRNDNLPFDLDSQAGKMIKGFAGRGNVMDVDGVDE